jgi:signal transduction histidine kinase
MVLITHRIFGPRVPILRMIENLKAGQYGEKKNLRKTDEMKDVMDALNSLSETLKERYPAK